MKNKKTVIIFSITLIFLFIIAFLVLSKENEETKDEFIKESSELVIGKIKVAVSPTFYYLFQDLKENNNIEVFETDSTLEGLDLMERGVVDVAVLGRPLREEELSLLSEVVGGGYDFIYKEEMVISEEEMSEIVFYTDLETEEVINDFKQITSRNIVKIEDIENYIEKGIVITSIDGLLVRELVHVLKDDGSRVRLSRLPRVYYFEETPRKNLDYLIDLIEDKK
ncbi:MAG: substrate-binding domain-containing protein [Candidatus Pacebacteria bacterium]|nr:substrate-binding domain-containing protein [Candidatus Paceibacterota bacterium]